MTEMGTFKPNEPFPSGRGVFHNRKQTTIEVGIAVKYLTTLFLGGLLSI